MASTYNTKLFVAGPLFSFSAKEDLRKLSRATNSVFNVLRKPKEDGLLKWLYSNCVPIITYLAKGMSDCSRCQQGNMSHLFFLKL
jgi:hypothetical protein